MAEHTPGPWAVGHWSGSCGKKHPGMHFHPGPEHPTDPCVYDRFFVAGSIGISGPNGETVVGVSYDELEISEADARLIAGAPDLFEACKAALAFLDRQGYDANHCDAHGHEIRRVIESAIARAEGAGK